MSSLTILKAEEFYYSMVQFWGFESIYSKSYDVSKNARKSISVEQNTKYCIPDCITLLHLSRIVKDVEDIDSSYLGLQNELFPATISILSEKLRYF